MSARTELQQKESGAVRYVPSFITPNQLSWARVWVLPCIWWLYGALPWGAFVLYVCAAYTDYLDGALARSRGQMSKKGKRLDELTDKVFVLGIIGLLFLYGVFPLAWSSWALWATLLLIVREVGITLLRAQDPERASRVPVLWMAKWKTAVLMVSLGVLMLAGAYTPASLLAVGNVFYGAAITLGLVSGFHYIILFRTLSEEGSTP